LGGLSLGLVEPGEAAAVGRLGFSGLLRAQPGDLLHQHRPPRHVPAWGDDRIRVGGTLASSQRRQRKGREGGRRRTEEDKGEDEDHGEEGSDEEDDGELQRCREAAARHGAGGGSFGSAALQVATEGIRSGSYRAYDTRGPRRERLERSLAQAKGKILVATPS